MQSVNPPQKEGTVNPPKKEDTVNPPDKEGKVNPPKEGEVNPPKEVMVNPPMEEGVNPPGANGGKGTPKSGGKHGSMGPSLEEAGGQMNTRDVLRNLQSNGIAHTEVTAIGSLTGTDTTVVSNTLREE